MAGNVSFPKCTDKHRKMGTVFEQVSLKVRKGTKPSLARAQALKKLGVCQLADGRLGRYVNPGERAHRELRELVAQRSRIRANTKPRILDEPIENRVKKDTKSWIKRHPVLAAILGVIGLIGIVGLVFLVLHIIKKIKGGPKDGPKNPPSDGNSTKGGDEKVATKAKGEGLVEDADVINAEPNDGWAEPTVEIPLIPGTTIPENDPAVQVRPDDVFGPEDTNPGVPKLWGDFGHFMGSVRSPLAMMMARSRVISRFRSPVNVGSVVALSNSGRMMCPVRRAPVSLRRLVGLGVYLGMTGGLYFITRGKSGAVNQTVNRLAGALVR